MRSLSNDPFGVPFPVRSTSPADWAMWTDQLLEKEGEVAMGPHAVHRLPRLQALASFGHEVTRALEAPIHLALFINVRRKKGHCHRYRYRDEDGFRREGRHAFMARSLRFQYVGHDSGVWPVSPSPVSKMTEDGDSCMRFATMARCARLQWAPPDWARDWCLSKFGDYRAHAGTLDLRTDYLAILIDATQPPSVFLDTGLFGSVCWKVWLSYFRMQVSAYRARAIGKPLQRQWSR